MAAACECVSLLRSGDKKMAEYLRPSSLEEAAGMIAAHGSSLAIVAGGTSAMRFAVPYVAYAMGVRGLGMNEIERSSGGLSLDRKSVV